MKKVIITGATSMIGIALIENCIKNNIEVLAVCRPNSINLKRIPASKLVQIFQCNLCDIEKLTNYKDKEYDAFYHLGWEYSGKAYRNNPIKQNINVENTLKAVAVAKELNCKVFIGAGSQAEYGIVDKIISPTTSVNPITAYGVAKYSAYKQSLILANELGMKHIWARIFSVYGENDNEDTMIMKTIKDLRRGNKPKFTKSEQLWDYLYSDDAGRALYLIGYKGIDKSIYCIGSGVVKPLFEYINDLKNVINKDLEVAIGELPYSENQIMSLCADITTLTRDTGFIPKYSFIEGITKTIKIISDRELI